MTQAIPLPRTILSVFFLSLSAASLLTIGGCAPNAEAAQASPPPPNVTVATVEPRAIVEYSEFTGRVAPLEDVEIRARVNGYLDRVDFESGQIVKRGDVLFTIDPRWHEAALKSAESAIAQSQVRVDNAAVEVQRADKLLTSRAISAEEAETRHSRWAEEKALMLANEAARDIAKLDLEYTQLKAPIDGHVSRALVTAGNYVSGVPGFNTVLATIVSVDPVLVDVDVDESSFLQLQRRMNAHELPVDEKDRVRVEVGLSDDAAFPLQGVVESLDNRVNSGTGSILMRVAVPNPDGRLVPGLFARVRVPNSKPTPTLLVTDRAIGTDQSQKFVYVVGADNTVQYRAVVTGPLADGQRVVRTGLKAGERIVVNGLQRVRPGAPVTPVTEAQKTAYAAKH